jgi:hypothetical protein
MIMEKVLYGLWHIQHGDLLTVTTESNNRTDCVDIHHDLSVGDDNYWLVKDRTVAEKASVHSEPWYNANYDTPSNRYKGETKVVKVVVCVDEEESL